jgi:aspartate-semialdehyde dehydrogenase
MNQSASFDLALVGATGLVGREMLRVLEERNIPVRDLIPVASEKSLGKAAFFHGKKYPIVNMEEAIARNPAAALFSAGSTVSLEWAPRFAKAGITVIDNSSAWRMDPAIKLVVPEVNGAVLNREDRIIANPNCSTIQMVAALHPLHQAFGIRRLVISTYQAVTGTGVKAVDQLEAEERGENVEGPAYPHPIFRNAIPHCDVFLDNDYTREEMKLVHETRKILGSPDMRITATAVRVPVVGGHSESVNAEFDTDFSIQEVRSILEKVPGIKLVDDPKNNQYPMPIYAQGNDWVYVGRLRKDESQAKTLNLWIVSDNLRKGAATNTVQILDFLHKKNWI